MALSATELAPKLAASGAAVSPSTIYGDFLATQGFLFLSFGEWIRVLGAIYIGTMLIKTIYQFFKKDG